MDRENEFLNLLTKEFPWLEGRIRAPRKQRIFTDPLTREEFNLLVPFARDNGFTRMTHVVGTDDGDTLGFVYIMSDESGILFALHESAPKSDPAVDSLTPEFPSLEWHERELVDLFGADVRGLPPGPHYPLPDGWPAGNFPLRKDWDPKRFDRDTLTYNAPSPAAPAGSEVTK
jgi:membrane-bound hydrogenase subunit beta